MNRRSRFEDPRFGALVSALRVVAAEADAQGPALDALRDIADGMTRGEPVSPFGVEVAELELPPAVQGIIEAIDLAFDDLLAEVGASALASDTLETDARWARMRSLAREALDELGIDPLP
jgi:hypothetical protein